MQANHKLGKLIKGRKVAAVAPEQGGLKITFDDQSEMKIETGSESGAAEAANLKGRVIDKVQQQETTLRLIGEGEQSTDISLKGATASVVLRDKKNALEYFD